MPQDPRRPLDQIQEARFLEAVSGLDFQTGLVVVVEPTGEDRQRARVYHAQGQQKLQANRRTGALAAFTRAVRTDPDWAVAYNSLGGALQTKGKGEHALAAFRTAVSLDPRYTEAQFNLASALARLNRHTQAIEQMKRVLALDPRHGAAHERLAIWYYYQQNTAAAWRHVHSAQELGRQPPAQFLARLEGQRPQPKRPSARD